MPRRLSRCGVSGMNEKEKVLKAAQTVKTFCEKTECKDCHLTYEIKGIDARYCMMAGAFPADWNITKKMYD